MIGLVNIWDFNNTSFKYMSPLMIINKSNVDNDSVDATDIAWANVAIAWGITVLSHNGYIAYKYFTPLEKIANTISYFDSEESLTLLRAEPEYSDFVSARDAYIAAKGFEFQQKIITLTDSYQFEQVEELINALATS